MLNRHTVNVSTDHWRDLGSHTLVPHARAITVAAVTDISRVRLSSGPAVMLYEEEVVKMLSRNHVASKT